MAQLDNPVPLLKTQLETELRAASLSLRRIGWAVMVFGVPAAAAAAIWYYGSDFYLLDLDSRVDHPNFRTLSPSGFIGHGYGIVGTLLFVTNLTYLLRRKVARWRIGKMRLWLEIHVVTGLVGGVLILFHSTFQLRSGLASAGFWSVIALIATGIVGRFLKAFVPHPNLAKLAANLNLLKSAAPDLEAALRSELGRFKASSINGRQTLLKTLIMLPKWRAEANLRRVEFLEAANPFRSANPSLTQFDPQLLECAAIAHKEVRAHAADAVLRSWRAVHRFAALLMVLATLVHVGVAWYYGFRWIWSA